jgi:hypothetical protein
MATGEWCTIIDWETAPRQSRLAVSADPRSASRARPATEDRRESRPSREPGHRLHDLLAGLVVLLVALGCFARLAANPSALIVDGARSGSDVVQAGDMRAVGNDLTFTYLPHYLTIIRQLDRTGLPSYWDASGFAGRPHLGNPQAGLLYPPVWAAWAAHAPSALGWLTFGHLLWAGIGTYVLARSLGVSRLAATVAAGCFEASPFVLAQTFEGHYPHVWAASWYPWAFHAFNAHRAGQRRGLLTLPIVLALTCLTGHPQEWYYLIIALSLWALTDAARLIGRGELRAAIAGVARWCAALGLSLGLTAIELVPDAMAQQSAGGRSALAAWQLNTYNPRLLNLLQLISPGALGGPSDYLGAANYWEALLAPGLVALILGSIAVCRAEDRRLVHAWLALTLGAAVFAGGRKLGLFAVLHAVLPGMSFFRVASRSLFLSSLGAAMLAGLGIEALRGLEARGNDWRALERRFRVLACVILGLLGAGAVISWSHDMCEPEHQASSEQTRRVRLKSADGPTTVTVPLGDDLLPDQKLADQHPETLAALRILRERTFWLAVGGVALILAAGRSSAGYRRAAAWALGALALTELTLHGFALIKVAPAEQFLGRDPISAALDEASQSTPRPFRIRAVDPIYHDVRSINHGFEKININDWFQVGASARLYEELYHLFDQTVPPPTSDPMAEALAQRTRSIRQAILDRLCVALLVSDHIEPRSPWLPVRSGTWRTMAFAVYRNATALPRAYVVPHAVAVDKDAERGLAQLARVDPREAVMLETKLPDAADRCQPFTPAEWIETGDPDCIAVDVATNAPGLLVVADTWMPGWSATLNGRRAPILRGNHAQRVIALPEGGAHRVVMRYRPPGLTLGSIIAALSMATWLALLIAGVAKRRSERPGVTGSA